jgi:thiol-disulfide isomerase/thioredoxin
MTSRLLPFFLIALLATTGVTQAEEPTAEAPQLIAVKFHADWCGSCKAMGSVFEDLQAKLDSEPVLFVELDLTTSADRKQAGYLMTSLGAEDVWQEHGSKTGMILLLDPESYEVKNKLTKQMDFKQMVQAIEGAYAE